MMLFPFSKRRTTPLMSSPLRSLNSLKMRSRSSSRTRWMRTCFAVCAAIRPKAARACFTLSRSPNSLSCSFARFASFGCQKILEAELFAELRLEPRLLRVLERDLALLVGHVVHHRHVLEEIDLAGVLVEPRLHLPVRAEHALGGLQDRLLDGLDEPRLVDPLVLGDHFDRLEEARIGGGLLLLNGHG